MPHSTTDGSPWRQDAAVRGLLRAERAWIAREREPNGGGPTVWLAPEGFEREASAASDAIELLVDRSGRVGGPLRAQAWELPLVDQGVRRLILQHAFDVECDAAGLVGECVRILAAPGELVVFGFNPWSAWNPWLRVAARRHRTPIGLHMAMRLRALFGRLGLEFVGLDRLGPRLPGDAGAASGRALDAGGPPGRAVYALRMRKTPASVIVLPVRAPERAVGVPAGLVPSAAPRLGAAA
jgi:hypothetical protein